MSGETVKSWLWSVAAKRVAWGISKGIVSILVSVKAESFLKLHGVQIDVSVLQVSLPASVFGFLEGVHDWLRLKYDSKWL